MSEFLLRRMTAADLPGVLRVQAECYRSDLLEGTEAFASRLALSPATCWVATSWDDRAALAAYLFTHSWPQGSLPPLNGVLLQSAHDVTDTATLTWFVHDMAVAPAGRGGGLAMRLYEAALQSALDGGLRHSRLIAVQSAAPWWRRVGYVPVVAQAGSAYVEKLADYGPGAMMMERVLAA
ncbi:MULTISPECIES: GNAT family N-acetyltransferase [Cupriavidus]|uniref:GCN5-related N-acetyltransferase n=1 Tax=Cupriavidus pinatubonensis (strain JMP 134 / LMG 1197) TaxID=264198 RepID=Q46WJ9_CUPPJ|nr:MULTISPECIES: GNAT family N-acetyltransferase [Cupriavidus]QYY31325.1 GNAT family N-acetyltransferase [Cupriavidus pinatubonensis]